MQSIPFLSLTHQHEAIRTELDACYRKVVDRGGFILGGEVEGFEKEYGAYSGVKHCVTVANGLDALYVAMKVLGIGAGDEVIVPSLTCAPTWMAVSRTGATIVPIEVHEDTYCMDETRIEGVITPKTKAIMPVNLYGRPASLGLIISRASQHNIAVIEDNAQGHGASLSGKKTGSFGRINATSFYPTKNLGALGDGGAITTDDEDLADKARSLRNYGTTRRFHHSVVGINSRLDELQAAFLRIKLEHLDEWNDERRKTAGLYRQLLQDAGDVIMPGVDTGSHSNYHLFVIRTSRRDSLRDYLKEQGIETDIHYPVPPHIQPAYQNLGLEKGRFSLTEKICETILSLPLWPGMKEEQVVYVCQCIKKFF